MPPHQDLDCLQIQLFSSLVLNPIALRTAKTLWSFGRSECNRVKELRVGPLYRKAKMKMAVASPDEKSIHLVILK